MGSDNILSVFLKTVGRYENRPCYLSKKNGRWQTLSWRDVEERVASIALGFQSLGLKSGDRVGIFASTRVEWSLCDLAILSVGAVTVPIYHSSTAEQASFILEDSEAKFVVVEDEKLVPKVRMVDQNLPHLQKIVLIENGKAVDNEFVLSLESLIKLGKPGDRDAWRLGIGRIEADEMASIVYTSGTTGNPKGAMLTHRNFYSEVEAFAPLFKVSASARTLVFLPLAHIFGRVLQFWQIREGFSQAYAENMDRLLPNMAEIRPTFFAAVPRIFEKVHEGVMAKANHSTSFRKNLFHWALQVGMEASWAQQEGETPSPYLLLRRLMADLLVFRKVRKLFGGRLRFAVSGGAPLGREIAQFMHALGILILEGYGLTETTAAVNCNRVDDYQLGTVGKKVTGVEEKIAEDGEILVRGPMIFKGYYKKPQETREVLTEDGWFHTGDIGEFDKAGFLKITDRKKDLIVLATGKKVPPQNVESFLKTVPFINQVMVYGDRRKYLTALVTLNRSLIEEYAQKEGIPFAEYEELVAHPRVKAMIQSAIEEKNRELPSYEAVKEFRILKDEFTQESGELTPTLKMKRKFVTQKYWSVLEKFYTN